MTPPPRPKLPWWPLAAAAAALGILVYAAIPSPAPEPEKEVSGPAPDPSVLKGRWQRVGDDYHLHVKDARADGAAEVEYFNPRPIRVGSARTLLKGNRLGLSVELRDENYPGSTYTLAYDAKDDLLAGEYYQAAQGQTFPVTFRREK